MNFNIKNIINIADKYATLIQNSGAQFWDDFCRYFDYSSEAYVVYVERGHTEKRQKGPKIEWPLYRSASQYGLTIVEVLVTLSIISLVLTAVTGSILTSFDVAKTAQSSFIASGLAQEGMEIVRNIRDSGFIAGSDLSILPNGNFRMQWNDTTILQPAGAIESEPTLRRDTNGLVSYGGAVDSGFRRTVTISGDANEKTIIITVAWNERGHQKTLSAESKLYNWK